MKTQVKIQKQQGMTLMEVLAALAIVATVVVGSLSLFGAANSSSVSSQMSKDVIALRTATQAQFTGQGKYGDAGDVLNRILYKSNKVPTTMSATDDGTNTTIKTSFNGEVEIKVATNINQFTISVTDVPADICTTLLTGMSSGWSKVKVAGADITTFPIAPGVATGANGCNAATNTILWTTTS